MTYKLSDICIFPKGKIEVAKLNEETYISTENMIPNRGGVVSASGLPAIEATQAFEKGDVLVSNIRPYFKKIWKATFNGGCSNDVLVFRAKNDVSQDFLYYVLADDQYFNYATATSKGTKMPRGDKVAIMQYAVPDISYEEQSKIASVLRSIDQKIELNREINHNLQQQAEALYKDYFVDFSATNGEVSSYWKKYCLSDFLPVITGKKNANISSEKGKYPFFSCSQDIAWTDDYSFEGSAILVAGNGDFNVKWYDGKFEAYQRTYVLIPHNQRYTAWLYYAIKYNLNKITSAARGSVIKFITKGNLEDFSFYAPSNLEKCEIIDTFTQFNDTIDALIQENYRLTSIRDTLLPKLMRGEIDVSEVEV